MRQTSVFCLFGGCSPLDILVYRTSLDTLHQIKQLVSGVDIEFGIEGSSVGADGVLRDDEFVGDCFFGIAFVDEFHDVALAFGLCLACFSK